MIFARGVIVFASLDLGVVVIDTKVEIRLGYVRIVVRIVDA